MKRHLHLGALVFLLFGVSPARAHDILQCSTAVWLRADRMEFDMVMSRTPARQLLTGPPDATMTPENFADTFHPLLEEQAANLFVVASNGVTLKPLVADVELTEELEIAFHLVYPLPEPGTLSITAPFIKKMDEGYTNTISVNRARKNIGYADLTGEDLTLEITVTPPEAAAPAPPKPATPTPPVPPVAAPPPPPTPPAPETPVPAKTSAPTIETMLAVVIILAVVWGILRRLRR